MLALLPFLIAHASAGQPFYHSAGSEEAHKHPHWENRATRAAAHLLYMDAAHGALLSSRPVEGDRRKLIVAVGDDQHVNEFLVLFRHPEHWHHRRVLREAHVLRHGKVLGKVRVIPLWLELWHSAIFFPIFLSIVGLAFIVPFSIYQNRKQKNL